MERDDFDELMGHVERLGGQFAELFRDVTGEDFDLEGAVRHYPLLALGAAAGLGAVGGWWLARKQAPQLPPPPNRSIFDALANLGRPSGAGETPSNPVERFIPGGMETVRQILPDVTGEEAAEIARTWVDSVVEPRLRQGLDNVISGVSETRFGFYLKQVLQGPDTPLDDVDQDGPAPPRG